MAGEGGQRFFGLDVIEIGRGLQDEIVEQHAQGMALQGQGGVGVDGGEIDGVGQPVGAAGRGDEGGVGQAVDQDFGSWGRMEAGVALPMWLVPAW